MSKFSSMLKKLETYEIPILSTDDENRTVYSDSFIAMVEDVGSIAVSFHVATPPDDALMLGLILTEVKGFRCSNKLGIVDSYFVMSNGDLLFGNEAKSKYEEINKKHIIEKYRTEKMQEDFLKYDENCFNC